MVYDTSATEFGKRLNKTLKNQSKYEEALKLAGDFIRPQDICPVENCKICGSDDDSGEPVC